MKHTPGPWTFEKHDSGSQWYGNIVGHYDGNLIRTITCQTRYGTEAEQEANAKLMVAVLDLLDACKSALNSINDLQKDPTLEGCAMVLELAIRKATE